MLLRAAGWWSAIEDLLVRASCALLLLLTGARNMGCTLLLVCWLSLASALLQAAAASLVLYRWNPTAIVSCGMCHTYVLRFCQLVWNLATSASAAAHSRCQAVGTVLPVPTLKVVGATSDDATGSTALVHHDDPR